MDLFDGRNEWRAAPGVVLPVSALRFTFSRGGGPGGQNVNKLNTRATLSVPLDVLAEAMPRDAFERLKAKAGARLTSDSITISAADSRSQLANRRACLARLRHLLIEALHRPRPRRATRPTRGSIERRLKAKQSQGQRKRERRNNRNPSAE